MKTGLSKTWISALFKRFQARYPGKWTAAIEGIEEVAVDEWSQGLAGITGEQIKHGLELWKSEWPPSLPEFRAICENKSNMLRKMYIPLPAPKVDKEKAAACIDIMRNRRRR